MKLFNVFKNNLPDYWNPNFEDDNHFVYLCTNIGIRAMLLTFRDIAITIERTEDLILNDLSSSEIVAKFRPYIQVLIDYYDTTPVNELEETWDVSGSSSALVNRHSKKLGVIIHKTLKTFHPEWLTPFIEEEKEGRRVSCYEKITRVEKQLYNFIISRLKREFGGDRNVWIVHGLPKDLRIKLTNRREEDNRSRLEEQYLYLIEYREICHLNWQIFKDSIPLNLTNDVDNKSKATQWIEKLNRIRNKVSHPTGHEITSEDAKYVDKVSALATELLKS